MAISLSKTGNAIKFTFENNAYYLSNGVIEVPLNSLTLVTDDSDMFTFKKSATNDVFISGRYSDIGMTKSELESYYKENMIGSTGGSGSGMTSGEVQTMIDESISGKADSSTVTSLNGVVTGHTADTTIHVTSNDKEKWNKVDDKLDASAYTPADLSNYYTKDETSGATQISNALNTKGDALEWDTVGTPKKFVKLRLKRGMTVLSGVDLDLGSGLVYGVGGAKTLSTSGLVETSSFNTYSASTDARLAEDEEVTSAALNALSDVIDDKADTTAVTASIAAAVSGKQDTLIAGTNIKTINNESLLGSGNIDIQGGGKAVSGGTNVSITTGETADTINCTLPISADTNSISINRKNIRIGDNSVTTSNLNRVQVAIGDNVKADGIYSLAFGSRANATNYCTVSMGFWTESQNQYQASFGRYNNSVSGSSTFGDSGNTLFSVGNGTHNEARHNAFEIRQNGDIYITKDGSDVKLQDQLGGGGLPESAFTTYTASTDARLAEDEEVTAAALNTLNDATAANTTALGGLKLVSLTQAQYDALATKDASTLYFITGSN